MPNFLSAQYRQLTLLQNTPLAEICAARNKIEPNNGGSPESQGGKEAEAYQGWRKQAKSREEKSGYCGTDLTNEYDLVFKKSYQNETSNESTRRRTCNWNKE